MTDDSSCGSVVKIAVDSPVYISQQIPVEHIILDNSNCTQILMHNLLIHE